MNGVSLFTRTLGAGPDIVVFERSGRCPYVEEPERFTTELDAWLPSA